MLCIHRLNCFAQRALECLGNLFFCLPVSLLSIFLSPMFHQDLKQLEVALKSGESIEPFSPALTTPKTPKSWSDVKAEDDPRVELRLLRSTWESIAALPGGLTEFGVAAYSNIFIIGGDRISEMFSHVDMARQVNPCLPQARPRWLGPLK